MSLKVYDLTHTFTQFMPEWPSTPSVNISIDKFHAKDGEYMLGQGRIDFKKVRQAIDDAGYSGWIQIEAAQPHGLIPDYTADRKYLKGIFPARL